VALIKAIVILPVPDELWPFLKLINQLRNDIAHDLEPELKKHLETVRAMTGREQRSQECQQNFPLHLKPRNAAWLH
jgi:hypothetical protein